MQVKFFVGKSGAGEADAQDNICIIVDILRTSNTILAALENGFEKVKPVLAMEKQTDLITAGEKEGKKLPNVDYGNSPTELIAGTKKGKILVLLSSNGIPCILNAAGSGLPILIGCLRNCSAVTAAAKQLAERYKKDIAIVLAGRHHRLEADDWLAGSILLSKLAPLRISGAIAPIPFERKEIKTLLRQSPAGKQLLRLGYEADIEFCSEMDVTSLVPSYSSKRGFIERNFF
ncbi:2-phosphosulfolactate phosphatase [Coxiella burnetii]